MVKLFLILKDLKGVTIRIGLHTLMLKKYNSFLKVTNSNHCILPLSETLCFSACLFKVPFLIHSLLRLVSAAEPALLTTTQMLC